MVQKTTPGSLAFLSVHVYSKTQGFGTGLSAQSGAFVSHVYRARRSVSSGTIDKPLRRRCVIRSDLSEDFWAGPSSPPRPRPLWQVVLFSVSTGLLWYGYYKYCVEEELKKGGHGGLGGLGALSPFVIGMVLGAFLPSPKSEISFALGLAWIVGVQFTLYQRINKMYVNQKLEPPLETSWAFIPPLNILAGLRSIHFLSVMNGSDPEDDPIVEYFPWLRKQTLTFKELVSNPSLWIKF